MRRVVGSVVLLPILALLLAAPAAAAPPIKDSGTEQSFTAFTSSCGPATCTDTFVDAFAAGEGVIVACVFQSTFNVHNGRVTSEESGCSETSSDALVIDDLSSASLAPTDVTFFNCNQQGCVEGDTVTVSAELTGSGPTFSESFRQTFNDGTCTFRQSFSGDSRQATGSITIDGETAAADGGIRTGKFSFSEHCR
jgi:hypothetical protein